MPVKAYISRDQAGKPWPPIHEHEASAAIGLVQRLYEAVNHEPALYAVFANLQAPSADLVVLSELGLGVVELKHYPGSLGVVDDEWYADRRLVKAGTGYTNPREQVQAYSGRIRRDLVGNLAALWSHNENDLGRALKIQTAVCFTNPDLSITAEVKEQVERDASLRGRRWSSFRLLTPSTFAAWATALRFGVEQGRAANFAPHRLTSHQVDVLARMYFKGNAWTEIDNLMPTGQPYAYIALQQPSQQPQLFPLRATEIKIGRDGAKCGILVPEYFRRASREHVRLTRIAGNVWLEDLRSSHGTFVDGAPVERVTRLAVGQRITLGGSEASEHVCELLFTDQLPQDLLANATMKDTTTYGRE
ncbi:MAG: FHA domain-containing protein [Chloroflexota bacterium]|nr:FHA domain-containing protein [Chloroflexota bacterium]